MVAGGVVPASEIDSDLLQRLRTPSFNADASEEYNDIKHVLGQIFGNLEERIFQIQCREEPIYRTNPEECELGIPPARNTDCSTNFIQERTEKLYIRERNEQRIFILLSYALFDENQYTIQEVRKILDYWVEESNKAISDFCKDSTIILDGERQPKFVVHVYADIEEISSNPLAYYNGKYNPLPEFGKPHVPAIMIVCAPIGEVNQFEFHNNQGYPDFCLYYPLISGPNSNNTADIMKNISKNLGNGFVIFQSLRQEWQDILAKLLQLSSVIGGRYLIGEPPVDGPNTTVTQQLSTRSFTESREFEGIITGNTCIDQEYNLYPICDSLGIMPLHRGWEPYRGSGMFRALKNYDANFLNCSYSHGDLIRDRLDDIRSGWQAMTYIVAGMKCQHCDPHKPEDCDKFHGLKSSNAKHKKGKDRVTTEIENEQIVKDIVGSLSSQEYGELKHKLAESEEIVFNNFDISYDDFVYFYPLYTQLVRNGSKPREITNKLHHDPEGPMLQLVRWNVRFDLIWRLKLYNPLKAYLKKLQELLNEVETRPTVHKHLMGICNLKFIDLENDGGEHSE